MSKEGFYSKSTPVVQWQMNGSNGTSKPQRRFSYRASLSNSSHQGSHNYYINYGLEDFKLLFKNTPNNDVLCYYELYKYSAFLDYARTLPEYDDFMKELQARIKTDKKFRESTVRVAGFASSFRFRSYRSEFHEFIDKEVLRIEQLELEKKSQWFYYQARDLMSDWSNGQRSTSNNIDVSKRLDARINSVVQGLKGNYNALQDQLCIEVSEIENRVIELEKNYSHDYYVKILTPLVRACAAQAIKETSPIFAFQLTDFSYAVTDVLLQGMEILYNTSCSVVKGAAKGIGTTLSIDHWKNMVTDTVQMAGMCIDAIGQEALFDTSYAIARSSQNSDAIVKFAQENFVQTQQEMEAFKAMATESYNKLKAMSWQEVVESSSEIGTTMILDTLVLNITGGCVGSVNKAFINKLSNLAEGGAIFTEQYAAEVAGFGKLIIEEGPECATKINDAIKKELIACIDNQSAAQQARKTLFPQKWAQEVRHKICNMDNDILDIMEKTGGHTLELHVGQTYNELLARSFGKRKVDITTFKNKELAIRSVKQSLKYNADTIISWLQNSEKDTLILEFSHKHPIGTGVLKGKRTPFYDLKTSRIVLEKDYKQELGFKILTAFPIFN